MSGIVSSVTSGEVSIRPGESSTVSARDPGLDQPCTPGIRLQSHRCRRRLPHRIPPASVSATSASLASENLPIGSSSAGELSQAGRARRPNRTAASERVVRMTRARIMCSERG